MDESLMHKLQEIQLKLAVPKKNFNSYGKFRYRSVEDILAAAKPLLESTGTTLVITDKMEMLGNRYYLNASVSLVDVDTATTIAAVQGMAREPEEKKGMDSAQVSGTISSYARKRALCALFLIDDEDLGEVEADSDLYKRSGAETAKSKTSGNAKANSDVYRKKIRSALEKENINEGDFVAYAMRGKYRDLAKVPNGQIGDFCSWTLAIGIKKFQRQAGGKK